MTLIAPDEGYFRNASCSLCFHYNFQALGAVVVVIV